MKINVLVVAGGSGSRMNSEVPKQFILLKNKPVLMHTIDNFFAFSKHINMVLVLPEKQLNVWTDLCKKFNYNKNIRLVQGGSERFMSVKNGLELIDNEGLVFIHDGVRPLVSHQTLMRCYETAMNKGNAIPVMPIVESLRELQAGGNRMADRKKFVSIQTPQVFLCSEIKEAYRQAYRPEFTDDASVLESMGKKIYLVDGNPENIKITRPIDLKFAEFLLSQI